MNYTAVVLGAGVVGLNCAIELVKKGYETFLVDRGVAGFGASYGNAGIIANYAVMPLISPGLRKSLVSMVCDKSSPLSISSSYAFKLSKFGRYFFKATRDQEWVDGGNVMGGLIKDSWECWGNVLNAAGCMPLVKSSGVVVAFEKKESLNGFLEVDAQYKDVFDIPYFILGDDEIKERVGGVRNSHSGGVFYPDAKFTIEPYALSKKLFDYYLSIGGRFEKGDVKKVRATSSGYALTLSGGELSVKNLVIAAGSSSQHLLKNLGINLPIASERGYHASIDEAVAIARPVGLADYGVFATPMQDGIRIAGLSEFASHKAPANRERIEQLDRIAMHHFGAGIRSPWVGSRSTTPDGIPYVGGLRHRPGLWINTGHGHLGLTLAAVTAKRLADEVESGFNCMNALSPHRHL